MLADQPEFASNARMRELLRLTEGRDLLKQALAVRAGRPGSRSPLAPRPRRPAERLHAGHGVLRGRRPQGCHRRDGTDPDAVRQDHRAGGAHQPPGGGSAGVSDSTPCSASRATRPTPRSRRPTGSWPWSTTRTATRARGGGQVQGDHRGVRGPPGSAEARDLRSLRQGGPRRRGGGFGFHHVDLSEALNIFMRDFGGMGGFESLFGGGRPRADRAAARTCG